MQNRPGLLHRLSNRKLPKPFSNKKTEHNSLYMTKNYEAKDTEPNKHNNFAIKPDRQRVVIYLLYENMKITLKV